MVLGFVKLFGLLIFLYLTWRNFNDNYKDELLVSYSWLALLSMLVGGRVLFGLSHWGIWNESWVDWLLLWQKPGFSYLGAMLAFFGLTVWYCKLNDWKLWSFLEDVLPIYLLMMAFFLAEEMIKSGFNLYLGVKLLVLILGYILSYWVMGKYRSWVWYKSGKKGFGFFFMTAICCLELAIAGICFKDSLILIITYSIMSLISTGGLFILGEILLIKGGKKNG